MTSGFRDFLFEHDHARLADIRGLDARGYREAAKHDAFTGGLIDGWRPLYAGVPFVGVTTDGEVRDGVYDLSPAAEADAAPTAAMVEAAARALEALSPTESARFRYATDAHEWRSWANPEFMQHDTGLRLEELAEPAREAILALVEASLSPRGYRLVRDCMRINGFLGEVVDLPLLLNEYSYHVSLFGEPSLDEPWGWQLFGHHMALNCLVAGSRLVVSPAFLGAEPDVIDVGPLEGTRVFDRRIELGRDLMRSLTGEQRERATVYASLVDPAMPDGRVHPGDERHLAGAFQDNRVIPYEGILVSEMTPGSRELVYAIAAEYEALLPDGPARIRLDEVRRHEAETWFSWMGGWRHPEPYYFRIQSPVAIYELDHHTGVFLANVEPAAFHMHTVMRQPNGNDYGRLLTRQAVGRALAG